MIILGADPGLHGALCWLDSATGAVIDVADVPVFSLSRNGKSKLEIDAHSLAAMIGRDRIGHAFVEQVGAMPGQGVSSVFAFGRAYGTLLGVLAACGVPVTKVSPAVWKKKLGVGADKDSARARASELIPSCARHWPLKKHDGRAEAALIALWGRSTINAVVTDATAKRAA